MRTAPGFRFVAVAIAAVALSAPGASAQLASSYDAVPRWTTEEMENLLAPVALYPDPILAQVLVAAAYPDQVELAADHVRLYGADHIDDQPWDLSVKAVAHYPPVLNLMADRPDWMYALGQAYAEQPEEVMAAVQSLRAMARAHGNLVSTAEQEVVVQDRYIRIVPAHARVVHVPVYDPLVVYHRPIVHLGVYRSGWSFGIGFPIGVWLTYDFDWRRRHIYYHGWDHGYASGWIYRSRPYVVINHIYVHPRPRVVYVHRPIYHRRVTYDRFDRYNYVHRVDWNRHRSRAERRYVSDGPSWDRDRRPSWNDDRSRDRNPSWDRDGRVRGGDERRAVPRSSSTEPRERATPQPTSRRQWDQPSRTQPQRARPQRAEPQQTRPEQRIQPQSSVPRPQEERARPRSTSERERAQPQQRARPQPRSSQPERRIDVPRSSIQRATPQRPNSERARPQQRVRPQPRSSQPERRIDVPRSGIQRAAPQRSNSPRATPQRSNTQRATPARSGSSSSGNVRRARPRSGGEGGSS